jgi:conjugal transfer pilin signal peptidase TrbI
MTAKRLYWTACLGLLTISVCAWAVTPWFTFTVNLTQSLPGALYLIHRGGAFKKGDLIAYRWQGGATYPAGVMFIKRVFGMPGDIVRRTGATFWVNNQRIGKAKPQSKAGVPLAPAPAGVIPAGEYFVATPHPDSLDSRYVLAGNVKRSEIIGRAYAIF